MKVFIYGYWSKNLPVDSSQSLLLQLIEKAMHGKVVVTNDIGRSDLIIVYPFLNNQEKLKITFKSKIMHKMDISTSAGKIFGFPHNKILAVSHENLNHPNWDWFGKLILQYNIPRLTFWPNEIDPDGCRFPYWWNYVRHDGFELHEEYYQRYGRAIDARKLLKPLEICDSSKKDAICVLTRHLNYPRNAQIERLRKYKKVDLYMAPENPWKGNKLSLISKYKYVFSAENSCGYGYETEKLPEAWDAGCIPVGYIPNPLGDFVSSFNSDVLFDQSNSCLTQGIIKDLPNIDAVWQYLELKLNVSKEL